MSTLAENLIRLQEAKNDIADAITEKGGTAAYSDGLEAMGDKIRAIPDTTPTLVAKTITSNGTYNASSDNADGYSSVVANVPNTYTASDEGKVVSNGALVAQGSDTVAENGTVDTTLIGSLTVNVESGGGIQKSLTTKPTLGTRKSSFKVWTTKTWNGFTQFYGRYIWTDGDNIYYSNGSLQYILNKATSTWTTKSWSGLTSFYGDNVWTDGDNIYYSSGSSTSDNYYILDKSTSTWIEYVQIGGPYISGTYVWSDGDNIYHSNYSGDALYHYVLTAIENTKPTIRTISCKPKFN